MRGSSSPESIVRGGYLCIDTFSGFPENQFARDVEIGTGRHLANAFSGNSLSLVRKLLDQWGCREIELLKDDIGQLSTTWLPEQIAVALIDVDIAEPTEAALRKLMPRMSEGGIILVDDCDRIPFMGARVAVEKAAPGAEYKFGMAVINNLRI